LKTYAVHRINITSPYIYKGIETLPIWILSHFSEVFQLFRCICL